MIILLGIISIIALLAGCAQQKYVPGKVGVRGEIVQTTVTNDKTIVIKPSGGENMKYADSLDGVALKIDKDVLDISETISLTVVNNSNSRNLRLSRPNT